MDELEKQGTFFKPGIVAERAMNFWVSSCLLFLSAIMWSRVWEQLLPLFPGWVLGFGLIGSKLRFCGWRVRFLEVGSGVAGIMVELSKDKMYVLGGLLADPTVTISLSEGSLRMFLRNSSSSLRSLSSSIPCLQSFQTQTINIYIHDYETIAASIITISRGQFSHDCSIRTTN